MQKWDSPPGVSGVTADCKNAANRATLSHMGNDPDPYGPRLMEYVDAMIAGRDDSPTAFAVNSLGISPSQFGRWRDGSSQPRLDVIVRIAEALGRPVLEVLAHTVGAVDQLTATPAIPPPTFEQALQASGLNDWSQSTLLEIVAAFRKSESGNPEVTATNRRRRGKK